MFYSRQLYNFEIFLICIIFGFLFGTILSDDQNKENMKIPFLINVMFTSFRNYIAYTQ